MSDHVRWETLNDYVDGHLSPADGDAVAAHLDACTECRGTLARLRRVLASAKASPASVEPPPDAWQEIRGEIELTKVVPLTHPAQRVRRLPWMRVAVIVAIVAASSATTVAIMSGRKTVPLATSGVSGSSGLVVPASVRAVERDYDEKVRTLTATLDAARAKLAPETVEAVERSLRVIDAAIDEARDALLLDPASEQLRGMLEKNYMRKVDLLERAAARATTS